MANRKFYYRNKNRSAKDDPRAAMRSEALARYNGEQLALTLEGLGIGESARALLQGSKISTAADLVTRSERDMYKVQGLNKRVLAEVRQALNAHGMAFMEDEAQQSAGKQEPKGGKAAGSSATVGKEGKDTSNADNKARGGKFGLADRGARRQAEQPVKQDKQSQKPSAQGKQNGKKGKQAPIPMAPERPKLTEPLPVEQWHKVLKGGKWGFHDGIRTVIAPAYDEVFCFKEGLASVELDGKCGYIDSENNIVIPFEYDTAMSFSEGLAMVVKGDKCGYINKQNELVFPFEYDAATPFENGEAKVKKAGKWATLTKDGTFTYI